MHRFALPALIWLCACTGGKSATGTAPAVKHSGTDTGPAESTPSEPTGSIGGQVVDASGAPLAEVTVNLCREVCRLARTDPSGHFSVDATEGIWALEVVVTPADPASGWATPLVPVEIREDTHTELSTPLRVPTLDAIVPLSAPGTYELTPGFLLTADPSEWDPPVLTPSAEPWLGAVGFDFAASGLPAFRLPGTPIGSWHVAPTASHPSAPWPLVLANPGLEAGESAEVWVSDYATQSWVPAGTVQPTADERQLEGAALPTLGTVLLVQPAEG